MTQELQNQTNEGIRMIQNSGVDRIANASVKLDGRNINRMILGLLKVVAHRHGQDKGISPKIQTLAQEIYPEA